MNLNKKLYISPINFEDNSYAFVCNWEFHATFAFMNF